MARMRSCNCFSVSLMTRTMQTGWFGCKIRQLFSPHYTKWLVREMSSVALILGTDKKPHNRSTECHKHHLCQSFVCLYFSFLLLSLASNNWIDLFCLILFSQFCLKKNRISASKVLSFFVFFKHHPKNQRLINSGWWIEDARCCTVSIVTNIIYWDVNQGPQNAEKV